MVECDLCKRSFKNAAGLTQHKRKCNAIDQLPDDTPVTLGILKNLLNNQTNEISETIQELKVELQATKAENVKLKTALTHQQKMLDNLQREKCRNNMIIGGVDVIPNGKTINDVLSDIFSKIGIVSDPATIVKTSYTLGDANQGKQRVLVNFKEYETILQEGKNLHIKDAILSKAKLLKGWTGLNKNGARLIDGDESHKPEYLGAGQIYLSHDETPYQRKENARLRNIRNTLREEDKEKKKNIIIRKGKVLVDDVEVDRFDITNQLF